VNKPFLVAKQRLIRVTDGWTKLVWFKQGFKGAVAKVGRAFTNSGLARPSEQPGAGTFDLLQVTQVRVVENPKSGLGRWFLFKKEGNGEGGGVGRGVSGGASFSARPTSPGSASFSSSAPGGGGETYDRYLAFVGLRESLYVEASSRQERDWLVSGFRQLLFGAEGRARARGFAHGRALESGHLDAQSLAAIGAASGAAAAHASHASVAAASASAMAYTDSTNGCGGGGCGGGGGGGGYSRPSPPPSANALYVFNLFDGDGNGVLDREEATKALVWAGFVDGGPSGRSQLESLFQRFDADGSGDLDVNEFAQLMVACEHGEAPTAEASASSNHGGGRGGGVGGSDGTGGGSSSQVGDKALLESFRRLDASGGGMLGEFEVGQWLGSVGIQMEEQQVRELFQKADVNKDGKLTFAEFSKLTAVVQQRQRA
jgi:Ca2+-binding EF-hand superfamily protein